MSTGKSGRNGTCHGFLPTEQDAVTEHTIALEKAAN